jgi:hypothetical protein
MNIQSKGSPSGLLNFTSAGFCIGSLIIASIQCIRPRNLSLLRGVSGTGQEATQELTQISGNTSFVVERLVC